MAVQLERILDVTVTVIPCGDSYRSFPEVTPHHQAATVDVLFYRCIKNTYHYY